MNEYAAAMTEDQFEDWLVEYAQLTGWLVHVERKAQSARGWRTPIKGNAGFPDVVLVRGGVVIFAELKSERGTLSAQQKVWGRFLRHAMEVAGGGVWYCVWQPRDRDTIEGALR